MNGFIIKNLWPAAKSFLHILMSRPLWTSHAFVVYTSGAVRVYEWVCVHELVSAFLFVQVYLHLLTCMRLWYLRKLWHTFPAQMDQCLCPLCHRHVSRHLQDSKVCTRHLSCDRDETSSWDYYVTKAQQWETVYQMYWNLHCTLNMIWSVKMFSICLY